MSPSKSSSAKITTPDSVKGLMIFEAAVIALLGGWLSIEYQDNLNLKAYVNRSIGANLWTYSMIIGIAMGLAGTVAAFTLWRNLRETKMRLEHLSTPKLRGSVRHALSVLPTIDEESPVTKVRRPTATDAPTQPNQNTLVINADNSSAPQQDKIGRASA